jgi:hypothetical protein
MLAVEYWEKEFVVFARGKTEVLSPVLQLVWQEMGIEVVELFHSKSAAKSALKYLRSVGARPVGDYCYELAISDRMIEYVYLSLDLVKRMSSKQDIDELAAHMKSGILLTDVETLLYLEMFRFFNILPVTGILQDVWHRSGLIDEIHHVAQHADLIQRMGCTHSVLERLGSDARDFIEAMETVEVVLNKIYNCLVRSKTAELSNWERYDYDSDVDDFLIGNSPGCLVDVLRSNHYIDMERGNLVPSQGLLELMNKIEPGFKSSSRPYHVYLREILTSYIGNLNIRKDVDYAVDEVPFADKVFDFLPCC